MTEEEGDAELAADRERIARKSAALASAMRALAHEQRLMILGLVATQERSVGEIEKLMKIPQPAVSQQLARLREDDLVQVRRKGRTVFYLTNAGQVATVLREIAELGALAAPVEAATGQTVASPVDDAAEPAVPLSP